MRAIHLTCSLLAISGSALAIAPTAHAAPAAAPCANPGIRDGARRTLHDASVSASALTFCTGEDCWSLDAATSKVSAIPTIKPTATMPPRDDQGKSPDGRATATATEAAFCPSGPASCKKFSYKFAFQPQGGLHPMINAAGTLGAVIYAGVGEDGEPRYLLTYDLVAGKLIKQVELKSNNAEVFRASFLFDNAFYSTKLKRLGALAWKGADFVPVTGTDLIALSDAEHGVVVVQDTATGKPHPKLKLGSLGIDQVLASPDGAKLYVITQGKTEGEVVVIDIASNKINARIAPPACAAGTTRAH